MSNKPAVLGDEQLDALLEADEAAHAGNALAIFARIHERRRKRAHAKAKATQPDLGIRGEAHHDALLNRLRAFWSEPLAEHDREAGPGAMDYALQTVADTLEAGDVEDAIFALARVARKVWAWTPHLGPIEGFPKPEENEKDKE